LLCPCTCPHIPAPPPMAAAIVLANLCVAYIMTNANEEAEEIMRRIEEEEARCVWRAGLCGVRRVTGGSPCSPAPPCHSPTCLRVVLASNPATPSRSRAQRVQTRGRGARPPGVPPVHRQPRRRHALLLPRQL
jgi:hypothetical protein